MLVRIGENGFDNDSGTSWKESLSNYSKAFIGNWNDFPVDVFFSVFVETAPVFVPLTDALDGPVE